MINSKTYFWAYVVLVLSTSVILSRVFFLTVVMGKHFADLAKGNMIRKEKLQPVRGIIADRNGKPLAMNIDYLGKTIRFYPSGEVVATLVGYLGRPTEAELSECKMCSANSVVGKSGLEKKYDSDLAGKPGEVVIQETADNKTKLEVQRTEPEPGKNIATHIDLELQQLAFLSIKNKLAEVGKSGAVVITKVNGEVLSLVSVPSYDPNLFIVGGKRSDFGGNYKDVESVVGNESDKPLFNRAISGSFAPGSVYKLVPALAALEEGKINKQTTIVDSGEIKIGQYRFGNWYFDKYGKTEGAIDVVRAIARSNDIFFYKLGESLGADSLISWTKRFGLGEKTEIDLPGEASGFVPTPYWREKTLGERWFLGNTYHLAIGQGDLMATPLQINRMTAQVISGIRCDPLLVGASVCSELQVNPKNADTVLAGMREACSPGGTGAPLFPFAGKIFCKTGTAQKGSAETLSNAWMSVIVPKGDDKKDWVVMTVLVEEGGEGSGVAAPVARDILPYIMEKLP